MLSIDSISLLYKKTALPRQMIRNDAAVPFFYSVAGDFS